MTHPATISDFRFGGLPARSGARQGWRAATSHQRSAAGPQALVAPTVHPSPVPLLPRPRDTHPLHLPASPAQPPPMPRLASRTPARKVERTLTHVRRYASPMRRNASPSWKVFRTTHARARLADRLSKLATQHPPHTTARAVQCGDHAVPCGSMLKKVLCPPHATPSTRCTWHLALLVGAPRMGPVGGQS